MARPSNFTLVYSSILEYFYQLPARPETPTSHALMFSPSRDLFFVMIASAKSGYWYGRIYQVYWSTVSWNIQQKRLFVVLGRALFDAAAFLRVGYHVLRWDFWEVLGADHIPNTNTLHFVMQAYEQKLNRTLESQQQDDNHGR